MKKIIIVSLILLICACYNNNEIIPGKITCKEKDLIMSYEYQNTSPILIDVRTKEEYEVKHLENAINIEYQNIVDELKKESKTTTDTPIIVYCKSGNRSSKAYESLKNAGYTKVYDLGSINNCEE